MANLIITVISIALVAVAALMGAWYGGNAFIDGQLTARANTIIQQVNQIKGAYILYLTDGNTALPHATALVGSDPFSITGKYLSVPPTMPVSELRGSWTMYNDGTANRARLGLQIVSIKLCERLAEILTKQPMGSSATAFSRLSQYGADCYFYDYNGNGIYDGMDIPTFHMLVQP